MSVLMQGDDEKEFPARSFLFLPANRLEWVKKVGRFKPHAVILDLEDAVPPAEKLGARQIVPEEIASLRTQGIIPFVRVNSFDVGGRDDVLGVVRPGLGGIMLPKVEHPDQVRDLHDAISYAEGKAGMRHGTVRILPTPESAPGAQFGYDLCKASPRVRGLCGGFSDGTVGDMAWGCGFLPTSAGDEQFYLMSKLVLDSRSAGALSTLCTIMANVLDDLVTVERLVRRARAFGYSSIAALHPSHVAIVNEVYRPTAKEVEHYRGMIAAMEAGEKEGRSAVRYAGAMVDYAMLPLARAVVAEGDYYARKG